jgi:hypothetical protein
MRLYHAIFLVLSSFLVSAAQASEVNWIFRPGYYTHSPVTGQRVAQYEPERPSIVPTDPTYQESGYRHQIIYAGNDRLNIVQTWGEGTAIRPYGEWEYPYRAGATPFGPWGNPQGPWTLPFGAWQNPYGLGRLPYGYGPQSSGYGPGGGAWQAGPQPQPAPMPIGTPGAVSAPPLPRPTAPRGQEL